VPTYQNMGDYLLVELSEPYSLDLLLSTIHEIADRCHKEKLDKVLVDLLKVEGNPSILDRYRFGMEIANAWGPSIEAAAIAQKTVVNYMAETVAVNRGARFKVFFDLQEARKWLRVA